MTDAFCDKDGCEGRIVVSEKYRDNKKGGRSREDLVMGLTQHMTVIIMPEGSQWSQVIIFRDRYYRNVVYSTPL